ncbi:MAG: hypothetical protein COA33_011480 [Fluviicola sp.]|nr:hypothetical protein [Fluviicola sp.]
MKKLILLLIVILPIVALTQPRDLTPTKKNQGFGTRDFRKLGYTGLQFQLGGTYLMTRMNYKTEPFDNGFINGQYTIKPKGLLGVYGEIGLVHFPKKRSKLSLALKTVLVSYYDWGLGFKYFRGLERMSVDRLTPAGAIIGTSETEGRFQRGHVYGRFSIHKNGHLKKIKKFYLDNSVGVNFDYSVLKSPVDGPTGDHLAALGAVGAPQQYQQNFIAQLHYGLGIGIKLKRGAYLIPGVRIPILGAYEWNKGRPTIKYFASDYMPLLFHIKYMFMFEKKAKSCPAVETNSQDKETQRNR